MDKKYDRTKHWRCKRRFSFACKVFTIKRWEIVDEQLTTITLQLEHRHRLGKCQKLLRVSWRSGRFFTFICSFVVLKVRDPAAQAQPRTKKGRYFIIKFTKNFKFARLKALMERTRNVCRNDSRIFQLLQDKDQGCQALDSLLKLFSLLSTSRSRET